MGLSRRNALIGISTIAAGAGAIGASGAFTSVEADRTVSIQTSGDSSAALSLGEAPGAPSLDDGTSYVNTDGDTVVIDITKLNLNAITKLTPLIQVDNNGGADVDLSVSVDAGWIDPINVPSTVSSGSSDTFGIKLDTKNSGFTDGESFSYTMTITAEQ